MGGFAPPPFGRGPFMPNYDPVPPKRKGMDNASQESNVNSPIPLLAMKDRINNRMGPGAGEDRNNRLQNMQQGMGGFQRMPLRNQVANRIPFLGGGALPPALAGNPGMLGNPGMMQPPSMGLGQQMPQKPLMGLGMGGFGQRMI